MGLAAETTGIMETMNRATFEYLRTRKQFGTTLSVFQALRHSAADMFSAAEQAAHLCHRGLNAMERGEPGFSALASAMKALSDDSGKLVSHEAVQLHGGMGVSDELDVSHYLRRLAAIRAELGSADIHRGRFAQTEVDGVESTPLRAEVRAFVQDRKSTRLNSSH